MAAILMGSLNATAKDYHYTTVAGDAMKTRIYTLDNGLKVYMSVNKEKPRLQANIAVKTGSRNDPAETTGLAHYLEHLMFKVPRNSAPPTTPRRSHISTRLPADMRATANSPTRLSASRLTTRLIPSLSWLPNTISLTSTTN